MAAEGRAACFRFREETGRRRSVLAAGRLRPVSGDMARETLGEEKAAVGPVVGDIVEDSC